MASAGTNENDAVMDTEMTPSSSNRRSGPPPFLPPEVLQVWKEVPSAAKRFIIKLNTEVDDVTVLNDEQNEKLVELDQLVQELTMALGVPNDKIAELEQQLQSQETESRKALDDLEEKFTKCQEMVTRLKDTVKKQKLELGEGKKREEEAIKKAEDMEKILLKVKSFLQDAKQAVPDGVINEEYVEGCFSQVKVALQEGANAKKCLERKKSQLGKILEEGWDGTKEEMPSGSSSSDDEMDFEETADNEVGGSALSSSTPSRSLGDGNGDVKPCVTQEFHWNSEGSSGTSAGAEGKVEVAGDEEDLGNSEDIKYFCPGDAPDPKKLIPLKRMVAMPCGSKVSFLDACSSDKSFQRRFTNQSSKISSPPGGGATAGPSISQGPVKRLRCPKCNRRFNTLAGLKIHGEKTHPSYDWNDLQACVLCGIYFSSKLALKIHRSRHHL